MNFLQPFLLWGLPLVLVPVLIHLFNRLRHRPMPWAAMMFLRSATRKSTRYARLRQFLILLFRVLAVFALIMALSRPLGGGWMGWLISQAPDTILLVLDRSCSMNVKAAQGHRSKLQEAVALMARTGGELSGQSRMVLIDSVTLEPREVESPAMLEELPWTHPTETAADIPTMLQATLDWMTKNKPGSVEIWIASDLQQSNWQPESDRWPALILNFAALPQSVRVRLLAFTQQRPENISLSLRETQRRQSEGNPYLDLVLDVERDDPQSVTLPIALLLNGRRSELEMKLAGTSTRIRERLALPADAPEGWGTLTLPADTDSTDNEVCFVYGAAGQLRSAVWATDPYVREVLKLAASPDSTATNLSVQVIDERDLESKDWSQYALVLWQDDLPRGEVGMALHEYVMKGGNLLLFPSGEPGAWEGQPWRWGERQDVSASEEMQVQRWDHQDGPLADTEEGLELPVQSLGIRRRQLCIGAFQPLAVFQDGAPLLAWRLQSRGRILMCATLPRPDWSRLQEGDVLVPLVRRLMESGAQRSGTTRLIACGEPVPEPADDGPWRSMLEGRDPNPKLRVGVYRSGARYLAVNRPAEEEDSEQVQSDRVRSLFQGLSVRLFQEEESGPAALQVELWRWFLLAMLVLLIGEAVLALPERPAPTNAAWLPSEARRFSETATPRIPPRAV